MSNLELTYLILSTLALGLSVFSVIGVIKLQKIRRSFFAGKQAGDLEEFILKQNSKINELHNNINYIEGNIQELQDKLKFTVQKMGIVRYNPFADDGGNLSFSMAILDDYDNGVVITSMHGRDSNRVYAKPLRKGQSEFQLTKEEQKAISISKNF